jgi:hypothetical protein
MDSPIFLDITPQILHGVISQKTELFITTAVRTSDPTRRYLPEERNKHKKPTLVHTAFLQGALWR